ncbi:MAG: glutaminyl-peptide cyclotransferase [Pyrinomonadaceae bacterium]
MRLMIVILTLMLCFACSDGTNNTTPKPANNNTTTKTGPLPVHGYEVVKSYPHDGQAFTQGLFFHDGFLYESTGQEGRSQIRKVEIESGKVLQKWDLPRDEFGEGSTLIGDKIYMVTWQDGVGRVLNLADFKLLREFSYIGEGWGLTNDGTNLIMSDGSHILKFIEPGGFTSVKKMPVFQSNGKPLFLLNELEFVNGEIWANIWHSEQSETNTTQGTFPNIAKPNYIARISPASGNVVGWIDLAGISPDDQRRDSENTLNGIAYDAAGERIFVTGKNWKKLYEIKIKPAQ